MIHFPGCCARYPFPTGRNISNKPRLCKRPDKLSPAVIQTNRRPTRLTHHHPLRSTQTCELGDDVQPAKRHTPAGRERASLGAGYKSSAAADTFTSSNTSTQGSPGQCLSYQSATDPCLIPFSVFQTDPCLQPFSLQRASVVRTANSSAPIETAPPHRCSSSAPCDPRTTRVLCWPASRAHWGTHGVWTLRRARNL